MNFPRKIPKAPKRSSRWRSQAHSAHVRQHECANCGSRTNVQAAHVRINSGAGIAQKPDDWRLVPLCAGPFANVDGDLGCHDEQHNAGEPEFWQRYRRTKGHDVEALIEHFIRTSPRRAEIERARSERQ